jgi:two-component sensor histidine kinase
VDAVAVDMLLLIDELVANAAQHASGPITMRIRLDRPSHDAAAVLYCEVTDTNPWPPPPPPPDDEHGRGLLLLAALAPNHGWHPTPTGKTVWFTYPLTGFQTPPAA